MGSVVNFPRPKATPACVGDLVVLRLKQGAGDWCALTVMGVDDEGAITTVRDLDGKSTALYRVADISTPWLVTAAALITIEGHMRLPGECAEQLEDLKAVFRLYFAGGVGA